MFDSIPAELKAARSWVCWKAELVNHVVTKVPYNPITGAKASAANPNTWNHYNDVLPLITGFNGLGNVLSEHDPYICIDLDNKQNDPAIAAENNQIAQWLDSYTEISPSGLGMHVWVKSSMPTGFITFKGTGVEVYSKLRYMTMTGNCIHKPGIIEDRYEKIIDLVEHLAKNRKTNGTPVDINAFAQQPEILEDKAIFDMAMGAENGNKFKALWFNDGWQAYITGSDTSQSVADQSLINMLVFYSKNVEQIVRLFHYSALGKRDKAFRKDYLKRTIKKAFDQTITPIQLDVSAADIAARFKMNEAPAPELPVTTVNAIQQNQSSVSSVARASTDATNHGKAEGAASEETANKCEVVSVSKTSIATPNPPVNTPNRTPAAYAFPPGLVGELAEYLLAAAPHPVHEAALVAALGLVAGICGRVYQVEGLGLNLYLCLLAKTGVGKNAISTGIGKLVAAVSDYPSAFQFVGPKSFASAQSFDTTFQSTPCIVSVMTEFGKKLKKYTNANLRQIDEDTSAAYLEAFTASNKDFMWGKTARSDSAKASKMVVSPALTIVAESTPHKFYEAVDEDNIAEGLVSRMLVVEYGGNRGYLSHSFNDVVANPIMLDHLKAMMIVNQTRMINSRVDYIDIQFTVEAKAIFNAFERNVTDHINSTQDENIRALWTRAYEKTAKLAGVIATGIAYGSNVSIDMRQADLRHAVSVPTICVNCANWAINLVSYEIEKMIKTYTKGGLGATSDDAMCMEHIEKELRHYVSVGPKKYKPEYDNKFRYQNPVRICVSRMYIGVFSKTKCFKQHKLGMHNAVSKTIETMCANGSLRKLDAAEKVAYQFAGELYQVLDV